MLYMYFHKPMQKLVTCFCSQLTNMLFSSLCQRTPLHIAAGKGYEYTLLCLIEQGADVNIKDNEGVCTVHIL